MKTISAGKFKIHCLALLKEVAQKQQPILVTKYGKPVAQVVPIIQEGEPAQNPLKDSILFEKDIVNPVDDQWEADQ